MPPPKYREARRRATAGAFGAGHTGDPCECGEKKSAGRCHGDAHHHCVLAKRGQIRMESRTQL